MQKLSIPELYTEKYDLNNCSEEPIHIIRRVQAYASLLVADLHMQEWYFASEDLLPILESQGVRGVLDDRLKEKILETKSGFPARTNSCVGERWLVKYERNGLLYVQLETVSNDIPLQTDYEESLLSISEHDNYSDLLDSVLAEIHNITGYDHVMIYEFDEDHNGEVVKELKSEERTSYLGLKFPASDIPEQARRLYYKELIRTIADTSTEQVPLYRNNASEAPEQLDLTDIHSRGVSPIHLEYLKNMGVYASFSVAIFRDEKLNGLIVCHNSSPKVVSYKTRKWLKFLSKFISKYLDNLVHRASEKGDLQRRLHQRTIITRLLESKDLIGSLVEASPGMLDLIDARGLIVKSGSNVKTLGLNVPDERVAGLIDWLGEMEPFDVLTTSKSIKKVPADVYDKEIAGLLIVQLSHTDQEYVIFTRAEETKEVVWAGNPNETKKFSQEKMRLTPRKSFEVWKGNLEDSAKSWSEEDIDMAKQLKAEIREFLYKKYNELKSLNKELRNAYANMESFSYTVSHDLKAPLRSIEGFAHIIKEDYQDRLDEYGIKLLNMIMENIQKMNAFIKDILNYSKLNSDSLRVSAINLPSLIMKEWESVKGYVEGSELSVPPEVPIVYGDGSMIKQVFLNLFTNSLKYVDSGVVPRIKISCETLDGYLRIFVQDNGIGIPAGKEEKIFEVFRRLVTDESYDGTGIGLATVKKVVERHGGQIKAERTNGKGAKFVFTLPTSTDFYKSKVY